MAIKPLYDRVLLKRSEPAETVKGGIIIPDTAKEKPMEAEVVAVGDGKFADDGNGPDFGGIDRKQVVFIAQQDNCFARDLAYQGALFRFILCMFLLRFGIFKGSCAFDDP